MSLNDYTNNNQNGKRILIINVACGTGSTGRICTDLAVAYEQQGFTVKIAYGRGTVPEWTRDWAVRIGNNVSVILDAMSSRIFDNAGFNSRFYTKQFLDWVNRYNPDIIHLHNLHGYYLNVELLFNYLRNAGKKIIWTMHDVWAFTGHSALCDGIDCRKWQFGCGKCPQLREYPIAWQDNSKNNWVKKRDIFSNIPNLTIVTPSNWLAQCVKKSFLQDYMVKVIPNGIDTTIFRPMKSGLRKRYGLECKFIILGVASVWGKLKGLDDFVKLAKMLNDDYQVVLIGGNIASWQKKSIINIVHIDSQKELAEWYSVADVFVNLSYCDTYPTVNIEAVSCGTPVITYETGGCAEAMHGYGGIVEKGNLYDLVDMLKELRKGNIKLDEIDACMEKDIFLQKYCELIGGCNL